MSMDQSQMPAAPTPEMSAGELVAKLGGAQKVVEGTAKENQLHAGRELEMIDELRNSQAFKWFEEQFIDKLYQESFVNLRRYHSKRVHYTYQTMRRVKIGMIERQKTHLELISPNDPMIGVLRAMLDVL